MVKNLSSNAGDVGSIPGQGTKIPYAMGQQSPRSTAPDPLRSVPTCHNMRSACTMARSPCTATRESPGTAIKSPCITMRPGYHSQN